MLLEKSHHHEETAQNSLMIRKESKRLFRFEKAITK